MTLDRDRLRAASATLFRNGLHDLADAVDAAAEEAVRLRDAVDRVTTLHREVDGCCVTCLNVWLEAAPWPCPTAAALTDALGEGDRG